MIAVILITFTSVQFVLIGSDEGLIQTASRQIDSKKEWNEILELTETNSTVITLYHDKLLFPERKVIVGLFTDASMNKQYAKLAEMLPLYYYNFTLPQKDLDYLNDRKLKDVGLDIHVVKRINKDFTLYKLGKTEIEKAKDESNENTHL